MAVKVAINGFGRIGRNVLRAIIESGRTDIEVIALNDLGPVETNAHLLRYDSVHGRFPATVTTGADTIDVGRGPMRVTAERDPAKLPWSDVDIALECTGLFTDGAKAALHLQNGSKRVLVSAPVSGEWSTDRALKTVVYGVNDDTLEAGDHVVSNGSCTTNCLAPVAQVLDQEFGIVTGFMTTIHSYTGDQPTLDTYHKDLYRARAAALSMIPTTTGAAKALGLVLPSLKGKLDGSSIRVPTPNVSVVDLKVVLSKQVSVEDINGAVKAAADGRLKGILGYETAPLVSSDYNHNPHSSTFAADQTKVLPNNFVRVLTWYDNEWGFSNRMADVAVKMGGFL
jgi:glyceraldehyde 3-phosphate dehydrogenase